MTQFLRFEILLMPGRFVIGYLIPNAALCPFVGALSDLFGRRTVAIFGQCTLIVGPIITATATNMNNAIGES